MCYRNSYQVCQGHLRAALRHRGSTCESVDMRMDAQEIRTMRCVSVGRAINSAGEITGYAQLPGNTVYHAFLYSHGTMKDLGSLGVLRDTTSVGFGINAAGDVTGEAFLFEDPSLFHAFIYHDGKMQDLGTLPGGRNSFGLAINAVGEVTGGSGAMGGEHAFVYTGGRMIDLNTMIDPSTPLPPNFRLFAGQGISNNGLIIAIGAAQNFSEHHAFLLTPTPH